MNEATIDESNMPDYLLEYINTLGNIFFVHEECVNCRLNTISYSSIWVKEVLICVTIMHKDLSDKIDAHCNTPTSKVIPVGMKWKVPECTLPFHLAMMKSAEAAKKLLEFFELSYHNIIIDDYNIRKYSDCLGILSCFLHKIEEYVSIAEGYFNSDDFEDPDDSV